jgi:glutamate formiminotransferase
MNVLADPPVILEAVPNFSEGRRPAVLAAIAAAIQAPGVHLLHQTSDWDHNRAVFTIAGAPDAVVEGLFQATQVAAEHINLFEHRGQHPRLGATDVIPLVPIQGITLAECAALATALGRRIGEELHLPVYLYEAAATRPDQRFLGNVRRGEFEKLIEEIHLPARQPDFGPAQVGPAGAVIVGARQFLIAFNIFLKTSDIQIAQKIARAVRERTGGLPAVRSLGLLVNGQAQVSINLVDFTQTPLPVVVAAVERLAAEYGTAIEHSELIGLIPQAAVLQAAATALHLPDLAAERILEQALQQGFGKKS